MLDKTLDEIKDLAKDRGVTLTETSETPGFFIEAGGHTPRKITIEKLLGIPDRTFEKP